MTISLNNNKNILLIIILCVILALIITFLIMDWSSGVSDLSEIIKYIVSCCCVIIALLTGKDALDKRDALLLRIAFGFIFLADTFLVILNRFADPVGKEIFNVSGVFYVAGICCFIGFHIILITRHLRGMTSILDKENKSKRIYAIKTAIIVCALLIIKIYIVFQFIRDLVIIIFPIMYAIILTISLWIGWGTFKYGFFPRLNSWFIALGLSIHFISDLCIVLRDNVASLEPIAGPMIWTLYGPAIVLLSLSGYKGMFKKKQEEIK